MDAHSPSFDADALLAEAGYLHALARELASDAHAADDLVQDTLLTALERPPHRDEGARGLRGWLATVLRNRARQRHRGEARRRAREQHVARSEATGVDVGDVEARMLLLRRLADAIAALPEPQRSAVTLRWIDGHSPAEVARAQGITPAAARQRLSRATAMLRESLDREYRDRTEWSAIALVLPHTPPATATASLTSKGVLMSTTTKVAASVLIVALAVVLAVRPWNGARSDTSVTDPRDRSDEMLARAVTPQVQSATSEVDASHADGVREVAEPSPTPPTASAIDRERDLHGVVLDMHDHPVSGARIEVTHRDSDGYGSFAFAEPMPPDPAPLVAKTTSAVDGTFAIALPPGRPHALQVHANGFADVHLGNRFAGERVVVHMSRGGSIHGLVTNKSDSKPVVGALVYGYRRAVGHALGDSDPSFYARTDADGRYAMTGVLSGSFWIAVQPNDAPDPRPEQVEITDNADASRDFVVEVGKTLHGRVTDADTGAPISDALVGEGWRMQRHVRTDRNGEYEYKGFPLEKGHTFGVLADGYGKPNLPVPALDQGNVQTVDVKLQIGRVLRCRIVARDGRALEGASVFACANGDGTKEGEIEFLPGVSRADGKVEIAGLRSDLPHVLVVRKEGFGTVVHDLPANGRDEHAVDAGDIPLDPMSVVAGVVVDARGGPIADHLVMLLGSNADRAAPAVPDPRPNRAEATPIDRFVAVRSARTDDLGRFTFADVAPGEFRVRAWPDGIEDPVDVAAHVTAAARVSGLKLVLDEGLSIEGHVFGPDGNPVEKASVSTSRTNKTRSVQLHAETDAQGRFRIVGLSEGACDLSVLCWDEHSETRFAPGEAKHVAAGTRDVVVRLRKVARIEGVVQEADGTPVPFATVFANVGIPGATPIAERGQADGTFFIDVAEGDVADLSCHRPSNKSGDSTPVRQDAGILRGIAAGTKGVVLRFPPH